MPFGHEIWAVIGILFMAGAAAAGADAYTDKADAILMMKLL